MAALSTAPTAAPKTDAASRAPSSRITGADGVRALAALWVLFSHLFQRLDPALGSWLDTLNSVMRKGPYGVCIFFVLSGMLLSAQFWRAYLTGRPFPQLGRYVRRRLARIAPGFWAALLVTFVMCLVFDPDVPYRVLRLITGLTFTNGFHWITLYPVPINGPLWSISFEVVCYALLPLTMWGLFRLRRRGMKLALGYWIATFALLIALNQWIITTFIPNDFEVGFEYGEVGGAKYWMPEYNPVGFFQQFCFGVAAAAVIAWWQVRRDGRRTWAFDAIAGVGLLGGAFIVWRNLEPLEPDLGPFQGQPFAFPWFAGATLVALVGLSHSRVLGRLVDNRFAVYTAKVSFGMYIWHHLFVFWMAELTNWEYNYNLIREPGRFWALTAIAVAASYLIAAASWNLLERPILESRWANDLPAGGDSPPGTRRRVMAFQVAGAGLFLTAIVAGGVYAASNHLLPNIGGAVLFLLAIGVIGGNVAWFGRSAVLVAPEVAGSAHRRMASAVQGAGIVGLAAVAVLSAQATMGGHLSRDLQLRLIFYLVAASLLADLGRYLYQRAPSPEPVAPVNQQKLSPGD